MVANTTTKPKKSVPLTQSERQQIIDKMAQYDTKTDAALAIGVSREVLVRIVTYGSCSEKTYNKLFGSPVKGKA